MTDERFNELFERHCDGGLSEADCRELLEAFAADPQRKAEFVRQLRMSNLLALADESASESLAEQVVRGIRESDRSPDLSKAVVDQLKDEAQDNVIACPIEPKASPVGAFSKYILPLAASLVVAVSLFFLNRGGTEPEMVQQPVTPPVSPQPETEPELPQFAARIVHLENVEWISGAEFELNEGLDAGLINLTAGMAKIDFTNGASVTVTGPAKFEIINAMETRLHSGSLSANIPETAHGFEVLTEAAQVVDLGTAFGVSVGEDGVTDVAVFEGEVEVKPIIAKATTPPQLLKAGGAVRAKRGVATLETAKFDPRQFAKSWRLAAGVVSMSGAFKFASPGPWALQKFEDDETIVIFPEQNEVLLKRPLAVDVVAPGTYREDLQKQKGTIKRGTRVRSYLLQFNPKHRKENTELKKAGRIRFQGRIVGLIFRTDRLRRTDALLGIKNADYGKGRRGLEGVDQRKFDDKDALRLFDDQKSLKLGLETGRDVDQVRVLVEARPEKQQLAKARARKKLSRPAQPATANKPTRQRTNQKP